MSEKKLGRISTEDILIEDRSREDYGDLSELKESLSSDIGLIQPIAVLEQDEGYKLLAGGRRMAAIKELDIDQVPAMIYTDLDKLDSKIIELSENIHRKNLTMQEELNMKKEIHDLNVEKHGKKSASNQYQKGKGWSMVDTAKLLGETPMNVSRDIRLAKAVKHLPELQKCKTKHEANKMLDKMATSYERKEKAKKIREKESSKPVDRRKKDLINSYIVGDFFEKVAEVPKDTVDFCELDWPYGIDLDDNRKYGSQTAVKGMEQYNEVQKGSYKSFIGRVLKECYRVMSPDSFIVVWYGIEHYEKVRKAIKKAGFKIGKVPAIWAKSAGQLQRPDYYLSNNWEPFMYARKGSPSINNKGRSNIFKYTKIHSSKRIHPTEKPIDLMEDIISCFADPGDRILVPFLGSGNTLLAANNLDMQGFGFDLSSEYKDAYTVRVNEGKLGEFSLRSK